MNAEHGKPDVLKLVAQNGEVRDALVDGSAWIGTSNLGMPDRVKDAGGPEIMAFVPKEGSVGFIDGEMAVKGAGNLARVAPYLEFAASAPTRTRFDECRRCRGSQLARSRRLRRDQGSRVRACSA